MSTNINDKSPQECSSITEVRNEIDNIDREIIRLISKRFEYVQQVVKYKDATESGIEATDRKNEVMTTRRQWATENGLDPDVIEEIYSRLVRYFIDEEKKIIAVR